MDDRVQHLLDLIESKKVAIKQATDDGDVDKVRVLRAEVERLRVSLDDIRFKLWVEEENLKHN